MRYFKTCPRCGAHLDPGESCDCRRERNNESGGQGRDSRREHPSAPYLARRSGREPAERLEEGLSKVDEVERVQTKAVSPYRYIEVQMEDKGFALWAAGRV